MPYPPRRGPARATVLVAVLCAATIAVSAQGDPNTANPRQIKTSHEGYNFYVYIPTGYGPNSPAGVHLYFHGQGGQGGASSFGQWKAMLDGHNLIGINMQYTDGDNAKDTAGKVAAAGEALRWVASHYRIIPGRGVIASFSGGGLPHAGLWGQFARGAGPWPFNHTALYGSNFYPRIATTGAMSWTVALGTGEWGMGIPTLGSTQVSRAAELLASAVAGGCPDVYLRIEKGKGHSISAADVAATAEALERSDLAFCRFLGLEQFSDRELATIVRNVNAQKLGLAREQIVRLLAAPKLEPAVKSQAEALQALIDHRAQQMLDMTRNLAHEDPVLCDFYGKLYSRQLRGHPLAKDLDANLASASKDKAYRQALSAWKQLASAVAKGRREMFPSGRDAQLGANAAEFLRKLQPDAVGTSLTGRMIAEFLALTQLEAKPGEK